MNVRLQLLIICLVLIVALSLMVVAARFAFETPGSASPDRGEAPFPYEAATLRRFETMLSGPDWRAAAPARNPEGMLVAIHEQSGLAFVLIPRGSFLMGSAVGHPDERPVRRARLGAFLLAATECTRTAYGHGEEHGSMPAQGVSWRDGKSWCEWARGGLRLPMEAEWEYACRAGTTARWSCGEDPSRLGSYAVYARSNRGGPEPVGRRLPNAWGLFDMHGNLWEWCEDEWRHGYARREVTSERVYRGGCWLNIAFNCRSANRSRDEKDVTFHYLGFRPAADLQ